MPAKERFFGASNAHPAAITAPATRAEAVTPHDVNELASVTRALYVGGAGNVALVMADGTAATLTAVPVGALLPIRVRQVKATGTTATNLVGLS